MPTSFSAEARVLARFFPASVSSGSSVSADCSACRTRKMTCCASVTETATSITNVTRERIILLQSIFFIAIHRFLFNHLICPREYCRRDGKTDSLGRHETDNQLELQRLLNRQLRGLDVF